MHGFLSGFLQNTSDLQDSVGTLAHPRLIANLSFQRAHGGGAVSVAVHGGPIYSGGTSAASPKDEPRPQLKHSSTQQSLVFGQQGVWLPKNRQDECLPLVLG